MIAAVTLPIPMKAFVTLLVAIVLAIAMRFVAAALKTRRRSPTPAYDLVPSLLTPAERSFYGVLLGTVQGRLTIFAKVRLADVLKPAAKGQVALNRVIQKHLDFVLCSPPDLRPVLAIELDDSSHGRADRRTRDNFLNAACASAGFPLVRIPARRGYTAADIQPVLKVLRQVVSAPATTVPPPPLAEPPVATESRQPPPRPRRPRS